MRIATPLDVLRHRSFRPRWPGARGAAYALLLLTLLPAIAGAQELPARYLLNPSLSRVSFDARATLGSFRGTAHDVVGWAQLPDTATLQDARGRIEVLVSSIRTGNGLRDRHLRHEMRTSRYPRLVFSVEDVKPPPGPTSTSPDGGAEGREVILLGELTIRDSTHLVEVPATVTLRGDTLRVEGRWPFLLTDFGIDPPSRLLGTARMRNEVELVFRVAFLAFRE